MVRFIRQRFFFASALDFFKKTITLDRVPLE